MTTYSGLAAWLPASDAPAFFSVDRSCTWLWQHPCLWAMPPVAWPQRSAAGICHVHPECEADAVMAARCRGFSDACVRGVAPPVWEAEKSAEEAFTEGVHIVAGIDTAGSVRLSSRRVSEADAPEFVRTGFGEYRLTLPIT